MVNSNSTATGYISTDNYISTDKWSIGTSVTNTTISTGALTTGTDVVSTTSTTISADALANRFAIDAPVKEEKKNKNKNKRMRYHSHDAFSSKHEQICYGTDTLVVSYLLPEIKDVKIIKRDEKAIGVIITFSDDSIEKAVVTGDDTFNLEYGITICLFKRMLADLYTVKGHETGVYNKLVEHVLKEMKKKDKERKEAEEKAKAEAEKERKFIEKKRRAKARRERKKIDVLADAIAKAMNKLNNN